MATSKKLPVNNLVTTKLTAKKRDIFLSHIQFFLSEVFLNQQLTHPHLLVAFSGGLDSTVLLHALSKLQTELPFKLSAMHVHHGLSANADAWESFCAETCNKLNISLSVSQVQIDKNCCN